MLKAAVPKPTAHISRRARGRLMKAAQACRKLGAADSAARTPRGRRGSCFHSATAFSSMVTTAAPCTTCTSRVPLKLVSSALNASELTTMPSSSATYSSATTRGRVAGGARSVASARPAVCVVCTPAPSSRKPSAAPAWPTQAGPSPWPVSTSTANGMIASPPNIISEPNQM